VPELDLARIRRHVDARVPSRAAAQVRMEVVVRGTAVTIVERRPPWRADLGPEWSRVPIAPAPLRPGACRVDSLLARPQSPLAPIRSDCSSVPRRSIACRDRRRSDGDLLGLTVDIHRLDQRGAGRERGGPPALGRLGPDPTPELGTVPTSAVHRISAIARRGAAGCGRPGRRVGPA